MVFSSHTMQYLIVSTVNPINLLNINFKAKIMSTTPSDIILHSKSKEMELVYGDNSYRLSYEFLRVHSPSAEVKGHGPGQEVLQTGKRNVGIKGLEPVGNYAMQIIFSDGHNSGIYSWSYLEQLCQNRDEMWQEYLRKLDDEGGNRGPELISIS